MKKPLALLVAIIYFLSSAVFLNAAEANFWADRKKTPKPDQTPTQLAALSLPGLSKPLSAVASTFSHPLMSRAPASAVSALKAVPLNAAMIRDIHVGLAQNGAPAPMVLLIQDVHMNFEAQTNIAQILLALNNQAAQSHQSLFVGVEGAFSPFDFEPFRAFQDKKVVKGAADYFLRENKFAAPSYTGITAEKLATVYTGIDDRPHYNANVEAYRSSQKIKKSVVAWIDKEKRRLNDAKLKTLNPELKKFDVERSAYWSESLGLGDYASYLTRNSKDEAHDLALEQFLSAYQMEKSLDFKLVEQERAHVIEKLAAKLTKDEINNLVAEGLAYQSGRISFAGYYSAIKTLIQRHHIDLSKTPAFDTYIRYVLLSDGINAEKLLAAVTQLEKHVLNGLIHTKEEKKLMEESRRVYLMEKLVDFSLTPDEWEEVKGVPSSWFLVPSTDLNIFKNFYEEADIRSQKMVDNLLGTRNQELGTSVLVVGGFHTPVITQLLKDRGLSYAIIQPKITKLDSGSGSEYLSIFTREKSPLNKLFEGKKLFLGPDALAVGTVGSIEIVSKASIETGHAFEDILAVGTKLDNKGLPIGWDARQHGDLITLRSPDGDTVLATTRLDAPDAQGPVVKIDPNIDAFRFLAPGAEDKFEGLLDDVFADALESTPPPLPFFAKADLHALDAFVAQLEEIVKSRKTAHDLSHDFLVISQELSHYPDAFGKINTLYKAAQDAVFMGKNEHDFNEMLDSVNEKDALLYKHILTKLLSQVQEKLGQSKTSLALSKRDGDSPLNIDHLIHLFSNPNDPQNETESKKALTLGYTYFLVGGFLYLVTLGQISQRKRIRAAQLAAWLLEWPLTILDSLIGGEWFLNLHTDGGEQERQIRKEAIHVMRMWTRGVYLSAFLGLLLYSLLTSDFSWSQIDWHHIELVSLAPAAIANALVHLVHNIRNPSSALMVSSEKPNGENRAEVLNPVLSDRQIDEVIRMLRTESYFRKLPGPTDGESYYSLRNYVRDLIKDGSLVSYQKGVNIYDQGKGKFHLILNGEVQLVSNPNSVGSIIPEFDGPIFNRGSGVGAWAVAGRSSHWGEMRVVDPVIALTISPAQYERLILLTISQAEQIKTVTGEEATRAIELGLVQGYADGPRKIYFIKRDKDIKKLIEKNPTFADEMTRLQALLNGDDFIYQGEKGWSIIKHPLQSGIKMSSLNQYILQENYLFQDSSMRSKTLLNYYGGELSNAEFLSMARNLYLTQQLEPLNPKDIYFIKTAGKLMKDPSRSPPVGSVALTFQNGHKEVSKEVPLPFNGVLDPVALAASLSLSAEMKLIRWSLTGMDPSTELYRLDTSQYWADVSNAFDYNLEEVVNQLRLQNYEISEQTSQRFQSLFREAENRLKDRAQLPHTDLSSFHRTELIRLISQWATFDRMNKGGQVVPMDLEEIGILLVMYLENMGVNGINGNSPLLSGYKEKYLEQKRLETEFNESTDKDRRKILAKQLTHLNNGLSTLNGYLRYKAKRQEWASRQDAEARRLADWRGVKHIFSLGVDEMLSNRKATGILAIPLDHHNKGEFHPHNGNDPLPKFNGYDRDTTVIPDVHENIHGLMMMLRALGWCDENNNLNTSAMKGKTLIQLGDNINRNVGPKGVAVLDLWEKLWEQAERFNEGKPANEKIKIQIMLGNHELDLLRWRDQDLQINFPTVAGRLLADMVRKRLHDMEAKNILVTGIYVGNEANADDASDGAVLVHAGMLPSVRAMILRDIAIQNKNKPAAEQLPLNGLGIISFMNEKLRQALAKDNFDHYIFGKSRARGGSQEFSGVIEVDFGPWSGTDFHLEMQRLGILDTNGKFVQGMTQQKAEELTKKEFGNLRIWVGHNFSTDEGRGIRFANIGDFILPNVLIMDAGDHQVGKEFYEETAVAMVIRNHRAYQVYLTSHQKAPRPQSEAELDRWLDVANGKVVDAPTKAIIDGIKTADEKALTPFLEQTANQSEEERNGKLYDVLNRGLNPNPLKVAISPRSLALLVENAAEEAFSREMGDIDAISDYIFLVQGTIEIKDDSGAILQRVHVKNAGDIGSGVLVNTRLPNTRVSADAGTRILRLKGNAKTADLLKQNPGFNYFVERQALWALAEIIENVSAIEGVKRQDVQGLIQTVKNNVDSFIVLSGGASKISVEDKAQLLGLFAALSLLADKHKIAVGDGGTQAGIMEAAGRERTRNGDKFPLVGVSPAQSVTFSREPGLTAMDPNHSHLVTVRNDPWLEAQKKHGWQPSWGYWGSETQIMYDLFSEIAENVPSLAIIANGGAITFDEVAENIKQNRPMIVIKGSGRGADVIVGLLNDSPIANATDETPKLIAKAQKVGVLAHRELFTVFDMTEGPAALYRLMETILDGRKPLSSSTNNFDSVGNGRKSPLTLGYTYFLVGGFLYLVTLGQISQRKRIRAAQLAAWLLEWPLTILDSLIGGEWFLNLHKRGGPKARAIRAEGIRVMRLWTRGVSLATFLGLMVYSLVTSDFSWSQMGWREELLLLTPAAAANASVHLIHNILNPGASLAISKRSVKYDRSAVALEKDAFQFLSDKKVLGKWVFDWIKRQPHQGDARRSVLFSVSMYLMTRNLMKRKVGIAEEYFDFFLKNPLINTVERDFFETMQAHEGDNFLESLGELFSSPKSHNANLLFGQLTARNQWGLHKTVMCAIPDPVGAGLIDQLPEGPVLAVGVDPLQHAEGLFNPQFKGLKRKLVVIDIDPFKVAYLEQSIRNLRLQDQIEIRLGNALEDLPSIIKEIQPAMVFFSNLGTYLTADAIPKDNKFKGRERIEAYDAANEHDLALVSQAVDAMEAWENFWTPYIESIQKDSPKQMAWIFHYPARNGLSVSNNNGLMNALGHVLYKQQYFAREGSFDDEGQFNRWPDKYFWKIRLYLPPQPNQALELDPVGALIEFFGNLLRDLNRGFPGDDRAPQHASKIGQFGYTLGVFGIFALAGYFAIGNHSLPMQLTGLVFAVISLPFALVSLVLTVMLPRGFIASTIGDHTRWGEAFDMLRPFAKRFVAAEEDMHTRGWGEVVAKTYAIIVTSLTAFFRTKGNVTPQAGSALNVTPEQLMDKDHFSKTLAAVIPVAKLGLNLPKKSLEGRNQAAAAELATLETSDLLALSLLADGRTPVVVDKFHGKAISGVDKKVDRRLVVIDPKDPAFVQKVRMINRMAKWQKLVVYAPGISKEKLELMGDVVLTNSIDPEDLIKLADRENWSVRRLFVEIMSKTPRFYNAEFAAQLKSLEETKVFSVKAYWFVPLSKVFVAVPVSSAELLHMIELEQKARKLVETSA